MLQTKTPLQMKCLNKAKLLIKRVSAEDSTQRLEVHWVILTPMVAVSFWVGYGPHNLTELANLKTKQKTTKTGAEGMKKEGGME